MISAALIESKCNDSIILVEYHWKMLLILLLLTVIQQPFIAYAYQMYLYLFCWLLFSSSFKSIKSVLLRKIIIQEKKKRKAAQEISFIASDDFYFSIIIKKKKIIVR